MEKFFSGGEDDAGLPADNSTLLSADYYASRWGRESEDNFFPLSSLCGSFAQQELPTPIDGIDCSGLNLSEINRLDFLPDELPRSLKTLFTVLYIMIVVVALVGNLLVMIVVAVDRKMRTVTNILLLSLAASDALIAALNMPFQLRFFLENEWTMGEGLCKLTNYVQGVFVVTSIFTLTGIAIDRYYAICRPLQARHLHTINRAVLLICLFWLVALVVLTPQLFIQRLEPFLTLDLHLTPPPPPPSPPSHDDDDGDFAGEVRLVQMCVEYFGDHRLNVAYTLCFYVALYVIPVFVMFVAYGKIAVALWRRSPVLSEGHGGGGGGGAVEPGRRRRLAEKKRVVRMLVVIVTLFSVSWCPFFTAQVYMLFDEHSNRRYIFRVTIAFLQLVAYSNCCINPVVYCLLNDSFKQGLRRLLYKPKLSLTETLRTLNYSSTRKGSLQQKNNTGTFDRGRHHHHPAFPPPIYFCTLQQMTRRNDDDDDVVDQIYYGNGGSCLGNGSCRLNGRCRGNGCCHRNTDCYGNIDRSQVNSGCRGDGGCQSNRDCHGNVGCQVNVGCHGNELLCRTTSEEQIPPPPGERFQKRSKEEVDRLQMAAVRLDDDVEEPEMTRTEERKCASKTDDVDDRSLKEVDSREEEEEEEEANDALRELSEILEKLGKDLLMGIDGQKKEEEAAWKKEENKKKEQETKEVEVEEEEEEIMEYLQRILKAMFSENES